MIEQKRFHRWVNSLTRFSASPNDYIQWSRDEVDGELYMGWITIYTRNHLYAITARAQKGQPGYLGCGVSNRKPLAGERHTRGNDLTDGHFNSATWHKIILDILGYELVKIVKGKRRNDVVK
jgi:hypothetical protein